MVRTARTRQSYLKLFAALAIVALYARLIYVSKTQ